MTSHGRVRLPLLLMGLAILAPGLQGCLATTVARTTIGVAGGAVKTTAKVTGKVAGATVHVAASAARHSVKRPPASD